MSNDEQDQRQKVLAERLGIKFHRTDKLIPLGPHSSFGVSSMRGALWTEKRCADIAFWIVGKKLIEFADRAHIIDHAWLAGFDEGSQEPWALVTEPYLDEDLAKKVVRKFNESFFEWEAVAYLLPSSDSSWNPTHCLPIIATFKRYYAERFIRCAVQWALHENDWNV